VNESHQLQGIQTEQQTFLSADPSYEEDDGDEQEQQVRQELIRPFQAAEAAGLP
jgi:hypothetical protein